MDGSIRCCFHEKNHCLGKVLLTESHESLDGVSFHQWNDEAGFD